MSPTTAANPVPSNNHLKTTKSKACCDEGCSAKDCHVVAEKKSMIDTVPGTVISSQNMADLDPEASAEPEVVREKAAMEKELCDVVHEQPATSESGSDTKDSESAKLQSHLDKEQVWSIHSFVFRLECTDNDQRTLSSLPMRLVPRCRLTQSTSPQRTPTI